MHIHIHKRKFGEYTKNIKIISNPTSTSNPLEPFEKESGVYSGAQSMSIMLSAALLPTRESATIQPRRPPNLNSTLVPLQRS